MRKKANWRTPIIVGGLAVAAASSASAEDCWRDVTQSNCESGGLHLLRFENACKGGTRAIIVCVKWTSGPSVGVVNSYVAKANAGATAEIRAGKCDAGAVSYNWRGDGEIPNCPR